MNKSILVIDTPKDCAECHFCGFGGRNLEKYVCCLTGEHSESTHLVGCPLKPLPNSFGIDIDDPLAIGWNACLNRILGDTK